MSIFTQGTVLHSLWRVFVAVLSFGIPFATLAFPAWQDITLGGLIFGVLHYAKSQVTS